MTTTHNLDFNVASYETPWILDLLVDAGLAEDDAGPDWMLFRVGTCGGQWRCTEDAYEILSVHNDAPGNGHFDDVLEWFEHSCKRDGKALRIREVMNRRFKRHLVKKRGFKQESAVDVIKHFKPAQAKARIEPRGRRTAG